MKYYQTTLEVEIAETLKASRSNDRETAAEAAQIAAMARKGILSNIEIYEKGGGDL